MGCKVWEFDEWVIGNETATLTVCHGVQLNTKTPLINGYKLDVVAVDRIHELARVNSKFEY